MPESKKKYSVLDEAAWREITRTICEEWALSPPTRKGQVLKLVSPFRPEDRLKILIMLKEGLEEAAERPRRKRTLH
jgi:hypothetical protein